MRLTDEYVMDAARFRAALVQERERKLKGGLYHLTQIQLAYNSNRIEGSKLTVDQTRYIFETKTIDGAARIDDAVETSNHFRLFDYMIDQLDNPLTVERIKEYHRILKEGTSDAAKGYAVGDWKTQANEVGGNATSPPNMVAADMADLLASTPEYMTFDDICDFHYQFEAIHPFQDGNGRIGRLILFEQCLKNNIMPFIVLDDEKLFYYRGLKEYDAEPGFLRSTFRHFQDEYYTEHEKYLPCDTTSDEQMKTDNSDLPPPLSEQARMIWAKSHPMFGAELTHWLPLWQHLHDAAGIAGKLWDDWLPKQVRQLLVNATGDDESARALLRFLAGVHDIGKATPAFAIQVDSLRDAIAGTGLDIARELPNRKERPHGLAGQAILENWLELRYGWTDTQARALSSVVGGHHGIPPANQEVNVASKSTFTNDELLGRGEYSAWVPVQTELLDHMAIYTGALDYLKQRSWRNLPKPVLALALSIVVIADWLASNQDLFPLVPIKNDNIPFPQPDESNDIRIEKAWQAVKLPKPWTPKQVKQTASELLHARFDLPKSAQIRPVQASAVEAARAMDVPGLLIIEAPMGEGKTEAALLSAEILAHRSGAGGVIVALPTQATSDAMFLRILKWLGRIDGFTSAIEADGEGQYRGEALAPDGDDRTNDRRSVFLAHGKAWLNPEFSAVPKDHSPVRDIDRDDPDANQQPGRHRRKDSKTGAAYVDGWMTGRRKGVLADFVVGTIDQVLFASLKSRHVALRHLALARKVVILDEVHSFDAYMNVYLLRALEWLGAYGVPVIALSATLPIELRNRLTEAYQRGVDTARASVEDGQLASAKKPRLSRRGRNAMAEATKAEAFKAGAAQAGDVGNQTTSASSKAATAEPHQAAHDGVIPSQPSSVLTFTKDQQTTQIVPATSNRARAIKVETATDADVATLLGDALQDGGCALVVRNTVARAQQTYQELRQQFGDDTEIRLLHSRFLAIDRKATEQWLLDRLGPPPADPSKPDSRPKRLIVVATQVVEQSLDLDFDLLITDLCPTDLLLQRIGRLHRHDERPPQSRPKRVREPRVVIVGVDDWAANPPTPIKGSTYIYGDYLLLRAAAQIRAIIAGAGRIKLPADIAPLVQAAYDEQPLGPVSWQDAMTRAWRQQTAELEAKKVKAKAFLLPQTDADLIGLNDWLDGSAGEADDTGARAQVRDSDDSIEVLVVQTDAAGQWRIPDWSSSPHRGALLSRTAVPSLALRRVLAGNSVRLPDLVSVGASGDAIIDYLEDLKAELDFEAWQDTPDLAGQLVILFDDDGKVSVPGWILAYDPEIGLTAERQDDRRQVL